MFSLFLPKVSFFPFLGRQPLYKPLRTPKSTRLVVLHPGRYEDLLVCSLKMEDLDWRPSYQAVSYVWGDPKITLPISCDSHTLQITRNLHDALQAIRSEIEPITLWVDAICIDQDNMAERPHQVKLMAPIYKNAERVLVWLGHGDSHEVAFEVAERLASDEPYKSKFLTDRSLKRAEIKALRTLTCFQWFHRTWTTQEIGLASSATVLAGKSRIDWETLFQAYRLLEEKIDTHLLVTRAVYSNRITFLYASFSQHHKNSFLDVLAHTRPRGASDPRDKVFALLSHPSALDDSTKKPIVEVDYEKSFLEVYEETAMAIIYQQGNLDVLSHTACWPFNGIKSPSWAPHWHHEGLEHRLIDSELSFNACGSGEILNSWEIWTDGWGVNYLTGLGRVVDTVMWHSNLLFPSKSSVAKAPPDAVITELREAHSRSKQLNYIREGGSLFYFSDPRLGMGTFKFAGFWKHFWVKKPLHFSSIYSQSSEEDDQRNYESSRYFCDHRVLFCTSGGVIGLGIGMLQVGDIVCILDGGNVPYVLRPACSVDTVSNAYTLVGECYLYGLMDGEIDDHTACPELSWDKWTEFNIM